MRNLIDWWYERWIARLAKRNTIQWRAGYDFAAGHLLRDGQPELIERLINLEDPAQPSKRVDGMRCAVRDYNIRRRDSGS